MQSATHIKHKCDELAYLDSTHFDSATDIDTFTASQYSLPQAQNEDTQLYMIEVWFVSPKVYF